jgi:hypothetical protein
VQGKGGDLGSEIRSKKGAARSNSFTSRTNLGSPYPRLLWHDGANGSAADPGSVRAEDQRSCCLAPIPRRKPASPRSRADGKRIKRHAAGLVGRSHARGRGREPAGRGRTAPGQETAKAGGAPIANGENGALAFPSFPSSGLGTHRSKLCFAARFEVAAPLSMWRSSETEGRLMPAKRSFGRCVPKRSLGTRGLSRPRR